METNYIIYKVTNKLDGKSFIGRTKQTLDKVKQHHWRQYNYYIKHQASLSALYQAFKDNQWDSFTWTVEDHTDDPDKAKQLWKQCVDEHDGYNGYNPLNGFRQGYTKSDAVREKQRKSMLGKNAHEHSYSAKLTEEDVSYIRHVYATHVDITQQSLAKQFGVTPGNISSIVNNRSWQYL